MKTIRQVQQRLKDLGFNPGPIDGIRGRLTIAAVKAFQREKNLKADGLVGPDTRRKLFTGEKGGTISSSPDAAPWLELADKKKGMHERRHNKILRRFLRLGKGTVGDPAKIPWCGDFVETCIAVALPEEPIPDNPYAAVNWLKFGKKTTAKPGAVLVFWRGSPESWKGHVGFYVGETKTHYLVLGGNQSNAVTVSRIAKNRLRKDGIRWPSTAMDSAAGAVFKSGKGIATTTNEV